MARNFNNLEDLNIRLKNLDDTAKELNCLNLVEIVINGLVIDAPMGRLNISDWGYKKFKEISWEVYGYNGVYKDKYLYDITIYLKY
jgi:hypothetical protein